MSSNLSIGPLDFSHQVQSISIDEQKAVKVIETTRSSKNLVADSGKSNQTASISLLFTDLQDINTNLKKLLILFKTSPIISLQNEMISSAWFIPNYSGYKIGRIPVALEQITVSTVPDIINALYVTLIVTRIDISITGNDLINYMDEKGGPTRDPFWLKKWIDTLSKDIIFTVLNEEDFGNTTFSFVEKNLIRNTFTELSKIDPSGVEIQSMSCSLRNIFSYHNLAGKGSVSAQYIGSSSRQLSVDLVFNPKDKTDPYSEFMEMKEKADASIRNKNKRDRLFGISIASPVTKILSTVTLKEKNERTSLATNEFFIPVNISTSTTDQPYVKTARIDFVESNHDFYQDNEIILNEGGSDYDALKKHYDRIVKEEFEFRKSGKSIDSTDDSNQELATVFWPIESFGRPFSKNDTFGILNIDTLKATFLSSEYDIKQDLLKNLNKSKFVSGKLVLGESTLNVFQRGLIESQQLSVAVNGPDVEAFEEFKNIYTVVRRYVERMLDSSDVIPTQTESDIKEASFGITISFLGNYTGLFSTLPQGEAVIQKLYGSKHKFSKQFTEALFTVVIDRKAAPVFAVPAYQEDSIYSAFFKLIVSYHKYAKNYSPTPEKITRVNISDTRKKSLYPDLILPTYIQLYGDKWTKFAPTYGDLGLINSNPATSSGEDLQNKLAVESDDFVSPAAWFYSKKFKSTEDGIFQILNPLSEAVNDASASLVLSIPFDVSDIDNIEEILSRRIDENDPSYKKEELTKLIKNSLEKYKVEDPLSFREDMDKLRQASSTKAYYDTFLKDDTNKIAVYYTSNGSLVGKRFMSVPGLASEIFSVAQEMQELRVSDKLPRREQDSISKSVGSKEFDFVRSLNENTKKCIKSSIDQVPDDHESYSRLFPACKVYLLEKRGTDLFGDDSIFSVNPIVSVDITLDKEDADLAVIRIADPMYLLQKDFFPYGNVQTIRDEKGNVVQKSVLSNLNGNTDSGYLKRYKLAQGRAIMIKMGYDSNEKCLKTVFTGRIAEIDPGEVLTIVAQGWKAELINRQVAFSNTNPKHWGVKDLVIQTIVNADPAGFGDFYPQRDTNFILRNITNIDAQEIANQVLRVQEGHNTDHGSIDNIGDKAISSIREFLGLSSLDNTNEGLDTRLKNIWYPEIPKMNNLFGVRSFAESGIDYINDGWVIPATPAWDVLKEAARHSWGTVVQVIPYDGEATIFFGQPDQPYFFTRGNSTTRSNYERRKENYIKNSSKPIDNITNGFFSSDSYQQNSLTNLNPNNALFNQTQFNYFRETLKKSDINHFIDVTSPFESNSKDIISTVVIRQGVKPSFTLLSSMLDISIYIGAYGISENTNKVVTTVDSSTLPFNALELIQDYLGDSTIPVLCNILYNIDQTAIYRVWPTVTQDFPEIIRSKTQDTISLLKDRITTLSTDYTLLANDIDKLQDISVLRKGLPVIDSTISEIKIKYFSNSKLSDYVRKITSIMNVYLKSYDKNSKEGDTVTKNATALKNMKIALASIAKELRSKTSLNRLGINSDTPLSEDSIRKAKLFVYFFANYLRSSSSAQSEAKNIKLTSVELPPTMQVFRVHHFIDDDHNIIKNDLVATTRDMWNTVVIEHPAKDSLSSKIKSRDSLYRKEELFSGIKWEYWPKQEVTGVIGLQFHPGLTLANKKVRIFTEPNVQTEPLAAKVAINRLAEGIRKMYRGTILMTGKIIKPHDRVVINDNFTQMYGTVGVESVIHHWSSDMGWVTNIIPEAIADANPGASILQTAALEAIYRKVFAAIDIASDIATLLLIISTLGAATAPAVAGEAAVKEAVVAGTTKALKGSTKEAAKKAVPFLKAALNNFKNNAINLNAQLAAKGVTFGTTPIHYLTNIIKASLGPAAQKYFRNQLIAGLADQSLEAFFKFHVVSGYIQNAQKAEQLPIIISPIIFNGLPLMAGLEVDDPIWSIYFNDTFWSLRDLQAGASRVIEENGLGNFESFTKVTDK